MIIRIQKDDDGVRGADDYNVRKGDDDNADDDDDDDDDDDVDDEDDCYGVKYNVYAFAVAILHSF